MKKNKKLYILLVVIIILIVNIYIPIIRENKSKNRVFSDIQKKAENINKSVIGIILETEQNGNTNHNGIGSGAIIAKSANTYYALTAKHVIDKEDSKIKIFTYKTKFKGETIDVDGKNTFEIPDESYYKSLLEGKLEYKSEDNDLAIISFKYDEYLPVLELSKDKISINDKIIAIGHTEGNRYKISYGYIKSKLKIVNDFGKIIEHNAYMNFGNSGGPSLNKNLKIIGINIGGVFSLFRHYKTGYMIPSDIILQDIKKWEEESNKNNKEISSWDVNKVTIKVTDISKDKNTATLIIEDKNEKKASWGTEFAIQKQSEGNKEWLDLISKENIEWLRAIAAPNEKGVTKMKIDWSKVYGELNKGTYRFVKYNGLKTIYSEPFEI